MTDLRELLQQTAATEPDLSPAERTAAVVRGGRASRARDRVLVVGAGVAVLATAILVPLTLQGGGSEAPDVATPAPTPAITASPCPAKPVDVAQPTASVDLGEVVAVRACPAVGQQGEPLPSQAILGVMAEAFAEDLAALPAYRLPDMCAVANVAPEPWVLQVESADGTTSFVGSTMRICSSVTADDQERGADAVLAAFVGNQVRQESGIPDLACPPGERLAEGAPTWNASFDVSTATSGVVCYRRDPMGSVEYDGVEATLDEGQLAIVRDELAGDLLPADSNSMCTDTGPQLMVVLEDADGDQAAWVDDNCSGLLAGANGFWDPGEAAASAMGQALSR